VCGILAPAGIPRHDARNAAQFFEHRLHTPKTSACKNDALALRRRSTEKSRENGTYSEEAQHILHMYSTLKNGIRMYASV
jgi:hypothetical protein